MAGGAIFFREVEAFSVANWVCFPLGVLLSFVGVVLVAQREQSLAVAAAAVTGDDIVAGDDVVAVDGLRRLSQGDSDRELVTASSSSSLGFAATSSSSPSSSFGATSSSSVTPSSVATKGSR